MAKNNDPDFCSPSSSSIPKERIKLSKLESYLVIPSSSTSAITKPKYYHAITKPDLSSAAPEIATRPCTECGKKFRSLKALFGHMRCHPERQWRGINPPNNHRRRPVLPIDHRHHHQLGATASTNVEDKMTEEEQEVASCLLMLANSDVSTATLRLETVNASQVEDDEVDCRFECSSCKKVFGSHQALGGHRASHKNVKGCFAVTRSTITDGCEVVEDHSRSGDSGKENDGGNSKMMVVVELGHKCEICLRVFSSGQALGGHKRCHWEKGEGASSSSSMNQGLPILAAKEGCLLDLNLPAPMEDESSSSYSSGLRPLTLDLSIES